MSVVVSLKSLYQHILLVVIVVGPLLCYQYQRNVVCQSCRPLVVFVSLFTNISVMLFVIVVGPWLCLTNISVMLFVNVLGP